MARPAVAEINLAALRHNLAQVHKVAPNRCVFAVIKANAYGHGAVPVARALEQADAFAVASIEEAAELRAGGVTKPILLLEGVFAASELAEAAELDCALVVHSQQQIAYLQAYDGEHEFPVWLKVETGMHRLGVALNEAEALWQVLYALPCVLAEPGYMTHFAKADALEDPQTEIQLARLQALQPGSAPRSLSNSAGILAWPAAQGDWLRAGIMLYGSSPTSRRRAEDYNLQPVMTLRSELIAVKPIAAGETVGYGCAWTAREAGQIGVVAIGYADGYPRHARNGTPVLVNGRMVPLVGRVSMDMICVNLSNMPNAQVGDSVVLWGEGLPVDKIAEAAATISYELLSQVRRVRFEYLDQDDVGGE